MSIFIVSKISIRFGHMRYVKENRERRKRTSYLPWRSAEVCENIKEELGKPYTQVIPKSTVKRISETNPIQHSLSDIGKFYTISEEHKKKYFQLNGFPKDFSEQTTIFNENAIMIRKPALEIIEYLKNADYTKLPIKYVISMHLHKYGRKEANISETRNGLVDLPLEGALLLKHFQLQNETLLNKLNLKTTKEYVWNQRESTKVGEPLMALVNHGLNRVRYSCDCIHGLINELKNAAINGQIKFLVAIGGFNSFYAGKTMIRMDEKYGTTTDQISIFQSFLSTLQNDWCNGAIIMTVCESTTLPKYRGSPLPFFLLRREGFETLDPFIPIQVSKLSELEFHSLLDYYEDRRWLQKIGARDELEFISCRIPAELSRYCATL
ncbi:hypothetical protein PGB90_004201 [Kerria lacca]